MVLLINSAGFLIDVEDFYADKTREEVEEKHRELFEGIKYMLPTSTAVVAAYLKKEGFDVIQRDLLKSVSPVLSRQLAREDFIQWLIHDKKTPLLKEYLFAALDVLPEHMNTVRLIGMSIKSFIQYPYALSLAKALNRLYPDKPICLGGSYITLSRHPFPTYISYVVRGDGGKPLCHLAHHLINRAPYHPGVTGLYAIAGPEAPGEERNQEPPDREELPDFSAVDLKDYLSYYLHPPFPTGRERPEQPYLTFDYRTSMGCANKCSFCTVRKVDSLRFKSVRKVIGDLKTLAQQYAASQGHLHVFFNDSSINNSPRYVEEIMDAILDSRIALEWFAYVKVHTMTPALLEKFSRAGCVALFWGIEAVTPKMLKIYNKRFQAEEFEALILKAVDLKIMNIISLIYNGPHESDEDFAGILSFLEKYSRCKPFFLPNLCEFILEENSDIYNNPGQYGIEVIRSENDPYSTIRPFFDWKETHADFERLKKQRQTRKEEMNRFFFKFWGREYR